MEVEYIIQKLDDTQLLNHFECGVPPMDVFIHDGFDLSIKFHYCNAYRMLECDTNEIVAIFALSFDSLDLDLDDKDDMMNGLANTSKPQLSYDYKEIFINKPHYPALDIAYLAVSKNRRKQGLGSIIISEIVQKAKQQDFAGCQFLTVEALSQKEYNAVRFYEKCGFTPCEYPNPNKGTLRMYRTLYPIEL